MEITPGTRVSSKNYTQIQTESSYQGSSIYEAQITNLFMPWLVEEIPDGTWQTLQKKLNTLIKNIISGKDLRGGNK